tara:strand:- start:1511 stop:2353 length:843 start_codon:yes stop_codon:yes gene_type:complete
MTDFFNTRELAIIFWLTLFLIFALTKKDVRKSSIKLIQAFFQHKLIVLFLLMIIYVQLQILGLVKLGLWDTSLLKDTIYWPMLVGFPLLMKTNKIGSEKKYLKSIFKDSIKGIVILEFIANFYSFSFIAELILIPIMTIVGVSTVYTKDEPKYKAAEKLFDNITMIFGLVVLAYTVYHIYEGFEDFANLSTLKSFLLPILLTITFLPFLYLVALWSLYETMLYRTGHGLKKKKDKRYLRWKMFSKYLFNRKKLRKFQQDLGFEPLLSRKDVKKIFHKNQD